MQISSRATSLAATVERRGSETESCFDMGCIPPPNYLFQTTKGQRWQKLQMVVLPILPLTALFIQSSVRLGSAAKEAYRVQRWIDALDDMQELGLVIAALQTEREIVMAHLYSNETTQFTALAQFEKTDAIFAGTQFSVLPVKKRNNCRVFLNPARQAAVDYNAKNISFQIFTKYAKAIAVLTNYYFEEFSFTHNRLQSLKLLEQGIERLQIIRTIGTRYFLIGTLTRTEMVSFVRSNKVASDSFVSSVIYDQAIEGFISRRFKNCSCDVTDMAQEIIANQKIAPTIKTMNQWYFQMSRQISAYSLATIDVRDSLVAISGSNHNAAILRCIAELVVLILSLVGFPVCCSIMILIVNNVISYVTYLIDRKQRAKFEKRKTEELLHQMLPKSVVMQLKFHKKVEAEKFDCVTVFFSDIKNFSYVSTISTPMQMVNLLNAVYNHLDNIIERYDVYKVETINEVYMVCSGLPVRNGKNHVKEIANLSLNLMESMADFKIPHLRQVGPELRVGINTGPCVAGIVGTKMPRYCLFGDTVNVAARMQTNSLPLKIHITRKTERLLSEIGGYITEYRGKVMIKGKGEMITYWLIGKEGQGSRAASIVSGVASEPGNGGPSTTSF
ncbi:soluble guanylate cyclase gcy-36-like [Lineus longissimus]|uniref:soluble guanylate cyclase gcy-36-like n=1 Tax=Lineus longissimus TaxID=88925 RepID=UPI002B4C9DDF